MTDKIKATEILFTGQKRENTPKHTNEGTDGVQEADKHVKGCVGTRARNGL